jgi:hypothetical protein
MRRHGVLLCLLALAAASLVHHVHNAEHLDEYPNMPGWLSSAGVYAAWLGAAAIGCAGYVLLRRGWRLAGLMFLTAYGIYGLDTLAHYALAPVSAHSAAMNLTISLEAATALALLAVVARQ